MKQVLEALENIRALITACENIKSDLDGYEQVSHDYYKGYEDGRSTAGNWVADELRDILSTAIKVDTGVWSEDAPVGTGLFFYLEPHQEVPIILEKCEDTRCFTTGSDLGIPTAELKGLWYLVPIPQPTAPQGEQK